MADITTWRVDGDWHWKHALALAKAAGAVLVVLGAAVVAWPAMLGLISQ